MFLSVITRIYAPFDQSLALIAEMFVSQVSADRLTEIYDTETATGEETFHPEGHSVEFQNVGFAYGDKDVLRDMSFAAKEGEVTALVGASGSGKSTCARLAARLLERFAGNCPCWRRGHFRHRPENAFDGLRDGFSRRGSL